MPSVMDMTSSPGQEGGLDVDLREFRLAICAQIFVAKTSCDLIVTIKARHHEQLLEQLR